MSGEQAQTTGASINRRQLLSGLGALGAVGVAGCLGGGGGSSDERVPTITIQHYTGNYAMENVAVVAQEQLGEKLGLDIEISALDIATAVGNVTNDNRFSMLPTYIISTTADGTYSMDRYSIDEAGSAGTNNANWPNCAFSTLMDAQYQITDEEKRTEVLNEAQGIMSRELANINCAPTPSDYGYRPDTVSFDEDLLGTQGFNRTNPEIWVNVEATGTDSITFGDTGTYFYDSTNFFTKPSQTGPYNNLIHSKLMYWDSEYEGGNYDLAESVDVSDDGLEYTVTLRDDATFHNGDPVTAEDVKFTFEWLTDNAGVFLDAPRVELSVDAVDDTTAVFNLEERYAPLISRDFHNWGILHRDTWIDAGANDDPSGAMPGEDMVGSGPFELTSFSSGQGLTLEPYEDHHLFDPQTTLNFQVYRDSNTMFQSLDGGDIDIATALTPPQVEQIENGDISDVELAPATGLATVILMPQCSAPPTQFLEFREALATALDYEEMMSIVWGGLRDPIMHAHWMDPAHPLFAPEDMLYEQGNGDPTGDVEAARQILEDAGWRWDDNDNLLYPEDKDLTPLWPAEGVPDPDDYPCLNEDGEFVPSDDVDLPIELPESV